MLKCELCRKEFLTHQSLVSHLTFKSSSCKSNIQEYYNKFLKHPMEGICKFCGNPTNFVSLSKGYQSNVCKQCNNSNIDPLKNKKRSDSLKKTLKKKSELHSQRLSLLNLLRKQIIISTNKLQCQICGKIFNTYNSISKHLKIHKIQLEDYYNLYLKSSSENICLCYKENDKCKKNTKFISLEKGYSIYCSPYCVSNSIITYSDKQENSFIKYNVSHPTKDSEINKKQTEGIHEVWKENKERILNNRNKTHIEIFIPKIDLFLKNINVELVEYNGCQQISTFKCLLCDKEYKGVWDYISHGGSKCPVCYPNSIPQTELQDFIKQLLPNEDLLFNQRNIVPPKELDIFIPSKNIAIEFNGLYWHSELILSNPKDYHLIKTQECNKQGIQLFHIFEDEWNNKKDIVKSLLKHKLGISDKKIYGRKCTIEEISANIKNEFLDKFHIQGKDTTKIKLGAFYNNELISVMTFGQGNISRGGDPSKPLIWELSRFATKYHIIGIAGKLLKYFQRNYSWETIYSYADLRYSNGNMYYKLGFSLKHQSSPTFFYLKDSKRIHRYNLRKRSDEPKDIPEWKLRSDEGYYRIWDCGHLKFVLNK